MSIYLPVYLSVYIYIYLHVYSIYHDVYLSTGLFIYLLIYYVCVFIYSYISVYLSLFLFIYLSIYLVYCNNIFIYFFYLPQGVKLQRSPHSDNIIIHIYIYIYSISVQHSWTTYGWVIYTLPSFHFLVQLLLSIQCSIKYCCISYIIA